MTVCQRTKKPDRGQWIRTVEIDRFAHVRSEPCPGGSETCFFTVPGETTDCEDAWERKTAVTPMIYAGEPKSNEMFQNVGHDSSIHLCTNC